MWSALAFLSAFLQVAQTPIRTCTEPRTQPCRPFLWSQAEVAAVGHPGLLRLLFLSFKKTKKTKNTQLRPRNQEQLPAFPLRFLHSVLPLSFFFLMAPLVFSHFFPSFLSFLSCLSQFVSFTSRFLMAHARPLYRLA